MPKKNKNIEYIKKEEDKALNSYGIGQLIAVMKNRDGKAIKKYYQTPFNNDIDIKTFDSEDTPNYDYTFQQLPIGPEGFRSINLILGRSGSGKSHYASNLVKEYVNIFKNNSVYLFSNVDSDEVFDKIPKIGRVSINEENFIQNPINMEELENSLCIFDDIDTIKDKTLREELFDLLDRILQEGRHLNISVIITMHMLTNGRYSKVMLTEAHSITYFPHHVSPRSIKYLVENYIGLTSYQINYIKRLKSRWATIIRNNPMICLTENKIINIEKVERIK